MEKNNSFCGSEEQAYIEVSNGAIVGVSKSFIDMTEYQEEELLGKDIQEIFCSLKVGPSFDIENIDERAELFLFTKSLEVRFIRIKTVRDMDKQTFYFIEDINSRLENKFKYVYQLLPEYIAGLSIYSVPGLTMLKANQMYLNYFGFPYNKPENAFGKQIYELIPGYKGSHAEAVLKDAIATGKSGFLKEYRYDMFSRGITYWDEIITPIKEDGRVKYIITNTQDVTERALNKRKIQVQNQLLRRQASLLNLSTDAIFAWDLNGTIIYWNKGAEQMYGYSGDEAVGTVCHYLLKTVYPEKVDDIQSKVLKDGVWKGEIQQTAKDGRTLIVETRHQIIDLESGRKIVLETNRDITGRKKMEKKIKNQKEQLEVIVENMADGLLLLDRDYKFTMLNMAAEDFFYNPSSIAKNGDSLAHTRYFDFEGKKLEIEDLPGTRALRGERVEQFFIKAVRPDKTGYYCISGRPIYNEEGGIKYAVLCIRDITEFMKSQCDLKKAQSQLLQAEQEKNQVLEKAIEMKDEFLSLISHEFRTPLNVINTAIQALNFIHGDELPQKVKEYMGIIRQNTFRQLRLVNNLLDITRADAGRIKIHKKNIDIVFLTRSITESVYTYASQKGVRLTFISPVEEKIVGIDDEKYERILLNLLSNAIKFTPEGKAIIVTLGCVKGKIRVEVKDYGLGIPEDKIGVIFERFGQVDSSLSRQAEGTGIGLSLVKRFVEALGGSISVKSRVGKGSTFTLLLPDEKADDEHDEKQMMEFMDNRLIQTANVEFSDIYL